jgi:two-component system CheB/CheR fusion protein
MEQRKDDFIKMASHELKTPITSINGYVQLLLNIYNDQDDERLKQSKPIVRSSLGTIAKQVSRLTRLVSELLDLSRIETGKLEMNKTSFTLEELVEESISEARQTTSQHAIIFDSDYKGKFTGDRDRIGQVMANLLGNAIKYSRNADKIEVSLGEQDGSAVINVRDFGIGIEKKHQSKIFERFYRAEGKNEQTYPGFGIGLFIANEIVQRHNGDISVKSQKGKGSTFTLTLPLTARTEKPDDATTRGKNTGS